MLESANEKESCVFDIEKKIHASLKKILLSHIVFKEAHLQDPGDMLHQKYKPLNSNYKPGQNKQQNTDTKVVDIPKPQVVLYPEENIQNAWQQVRRIGPGLANLGNTCFLNSVMQVLTYTPPLINYILSGYHKNNCKTVGFCMQCELTNHINRVVHHNPNMGAVRPMSIIQKLQCIGKSFRFGRQEDAHEFLRFVVEAIQKSDYAGKPKLDKVSKETTVANAIFGGYYRSQVQCKRCHLESNTYDPMMDLNLDIKDCSSILHAFQKTIRPDYLTGENKYFCERCKMKTDAVKRGNIHKEPNVLTLQLKRFDFSKMFGGKISKEIHFPEDLNIRPFMSVKAGDPVCYQLYGVLVHSGYSCNSGHYYCYVKAPNGTWYEMNDNRVAQVSMKTVLGAQAYLLFYVKRATKKSLNVSKVSASATSTAKDPLKHKNVIGDNNNNNNHEKKTAVVYGPQKPPRFKDVPIFLNKPTSSSKVTQPTSTTTSTTASIGVPVKRKSEPKININIGSKIKNALNKPSIFSYLDKTPVKEGSATSNASTTTPHKQSVKKPSLIATSTPHKPTEESNKQAQSKVNSLQKLSESYADPESPNSSVPSSPMERPPSPLPLSLPSPLVTNVRGKDASANVSSGNTSKTSAKEKSEMETTASESLYLSLSSSTEQPNGNKSANSNSKLKITTIKYRNRNSIWSPVTKGALHPRVVINKCISSSDNESQKTKDEPTSPPAGKQENAAPPQLPADLSVTTVSLWKDDKQSTQERMFGPMMPPPPAFKRQRNDSMTSEAGSSSSVLSQSGNWNIYEKAVDRKSSQEKRSKEFQRERQHVGWNVSESNTSEQEDSGQSKKKSKKEKKKKKKKKRKHHSSSEDKPGVHDNNNDDDDDDDDYIEVSIDRNNRKRKHDDTGRESLDHSTSASTQTFFESPKKKKKKDKRERERERSVSPPETYVVKLDKKKKKKEKRKRKHRNETDHVRKELSDTLKKQHTQHLSRVNTSSAGEVQHSSYTTADISTARDGSRHSDSQLTMGTKKSVSFNTQRCIDKEKGSSRDKKSTEHNSMYLTDNETHFSYSSVSSKKSKKKRKHKKERENSSSDNDSTSHERHPSPTLTKNKSSQERHSIPTPTKTSSQERHLSPTPTKNSSQERHLSPTLTKTSSQERHLSKALTKTSSHERHSLPTQTKESSNALSSSNHKTRQEGCFSDNHETDDTFVSDKKEKPFEKKKDVPVYTWDDETKKLNTWDGAVKSKTVEQLLSGGPRVSSWEGSDSTGLYALKNTSEGERGQDEWDEEYDAGKTKKAKSKPRESDDQLRYQASFNSFQTLQTHRNDTKDKQATFRSHGHHGYHDSKNRHHRKDKISGGGGGGGNGGRFR